jgi:ubiquinone/menaquinone biosynthesis C-methylase UbiE
MVTNNNLYINNWKDSDVEDHWDKVAHIYIRENNRIQQTHEQRFVESIKWLDINNNSKVLNISSRDCKATEYILKTEPKAQVINAEISQGLIDVTKKNMPDVKQVKISTYSDLPFKDKSFNRVLTLETLEHVENPIKFLEELFRVSTEDVRMVLSCPPGTSEIPYQIYTIIFGGHGEGPHRFLRSKVVKEMFNKTRWRLLQHYSTLLIPVGPACLRRFGERIIDKYQHTFISEFGIRQFYICEKY